MSRSPKVNACDKCGSVPIVFRSVPGKMWTVACAPCFASCRGITVKSAIENWNKYHPHPEEPKCET